MDSALNQDIDFREFESDIGKNISKKSYEIIVVENVDDFSTKSKAQEMLENEYFGKVTYYKNEANLGLFGNWNRCIELAKGKWVCLLHSDDLLMPNYLREMKNALSKLNDKKVGMVSVESIYFGEQCDERTYYLPPYQRFCHISHNFYTNAKDCVFPYFHPGGLLHNKRIITELGGYNGDEYPAGDTLFLRRVCEKYAVLVYQKFLHLSRQEINEGLKSDIEDKYAYQYFHFYKSCAPVNETLRRFYLSQLRQNFTGNFWRNRSVKDGTINALYRDINLHFSAYEKFIIFLCRAKNKLKMIGNKFIINRYLR